MAPPYVLVLDQGGHSSRALVFDAVGCVVANVSVTVSTQYPAVGCVEQNPAEILQSLRDVIATVAAQLGDHCKDIIAAALIVQRSSLVALDETSGEPLSPILSWQDTRHACWLTEKSKNQLPFLRQLTGLRANAHYGASKMRWLLDNTAVVHAAARQNRLCLAPLAGYLCRCLTEAKHTAIDAVIASRTLLTEMSALQWSPTLLDFFAIPQAVLPEMRASLADYGEIAVGDIKVPLRLLGGDQSFFMLSYGTQFDDGTVFINAGTGAFVQQWMPTTDVPQQLLVSPLMIAADPKNTVVVAEGTVNAAAAALDWWQQQSGIVLSDEFWQKAELTCCRYPNEVPVFVNRITASGSPDWLPAGESFFNAEAALPLKTMAVLEAIVFALQRNMDLLEQRKPCSTIVMSGGLSKLDIFCQRIASLSGKLVLRSDDTEACARGAAMQLLPSATGDQQFERFDPVVDENLCKRYQRWTTQMDQLSMADG